jgi:ABC-type glycerol-3-phosphate transport system permease component
MLLKSTRRVLLHIGAYAVVLFFMLPFLWMISVALKPPDEIFTFPPSFVPKHLTLVNFIRAVQPELLRYALNSVVVSTSTAVLTILVGVLSAYSFLGCDSSADVHFWWASLPRSCYRWRSFSSRSTGR